MHGPRLSPNRLSATFQAIAVLGLFAVLWSLPVCDASAYEPFTNAEDFRTITEQRSASIVETEPGVRYLHGINPAAMCPTCAAPDPDDHVAQGDTFVERFAIVIPVPAPVAIDPTFRLPEQATAGVSLAVDPEIAPPRPRAID